MRKAAHGGDVDAAVLNYGLDRAEIRDFSGTLNPFSMPQKARQAIIANINSMGLYPDANYKTLKQAIAKYVNVESPACITVGNGLTELVSLFARTLGRDESRSALIVAPAYTEYERELNFSGINCVYYTLSESEHFQCNINEIISRINESISVVIMCNPNNPTGTALTRKEVEKICRHCALTKTKVLVDETYCEFADEEKYSSISSVNKFENLIVMRGTAKFFAVPGIRLGYAVGNEKAIAAINKIRQPWSVNIFAVIAGESFFSDYEYISKSKHYITNERDRIYTGLSMWENIRVYKSCTNFLLFKLLKSSYTAAIVHEMLITKGFIVKDCSSFKFLGNKFIRFCILGEEDNRKLMDELRQFCR